MAVPLRPVSLTRVLVVDDSVVARQMVARALRDEDGLELAGLAANGRVALDRVASLHPDVVVLDLDMPEMDGFQTLEVMRRDHPDIPVIVFSNLTARGATSTFDALALGARAYVLKPSTQPGGAEVDSVRDQLLPLIRSLAPRGTPLPASAPTTAPPPTTRTAMAAVAARAPAASARVTAITVAASTGGPNALTTIITALPADLPVPVLVVQHMPAVFTRTLAERLDALAAVSVVEAADGQPVRPGRVYIAPGGHHLAVARSLAGAVGVLIHEGPPENSCRPAADVLFRTAAAVWGAGVLGVVLTGMGRDGLRGAEDVRAAGGAVVAESRTTAVVASMPGAVADAGLADVVLPVEQIAAELVRRARGTW